MATTLREFQMYDPSAELEELADALDGVSIDQDLQMDLAAVNTNELTVCFVDLVKSHLAAVSGCFTVLDKLLVSSGAPPQIQEQANNLRSAISSTLAASVYVRNNIITLVQCSARFMDGLKRCKDSRLRGSSKEKAMLHYKSAYDDLRSVCTAFNKISSWDPTELQEKLSVYLQVTGQETLAQVFEDLNNIENELIEEHKKLEEPEKRVHRATIKVSNLLIQLQHEEHSEKHRNIYIKMLTEHLQHLAERVKDIGSEMDNSQPRSFWARLLGMDSRVEYRRRYDELQQEMKNVTKNIKDGYIQPSKEYLAKQTRLETARIELSDAKEELNRIHDSVKAKIENLQKRKALILQTSRDAAMLAGDK
jgi:hypothetical protein